MNKYKWICLVGAAAGYWILLLLAAGGESVLRAALEYLKPSTLFEESPWGGCIAAKEAAPDSLTALVQQQVNRYQLEVQKVSVLICDPPRFLDHHPGLPVSPDVWWRVPVGCCTVQHERHYLITAGEAHGESSIVLNVIAIENRWSYLARRLRLMSVSEVKLGAILFGLLVCAGGVLWILRLSIQSALAAWRQRRDSSIPPA